MRPDARLHSDEAAGQVAALVRDLDVGAPFHQGAGEVGPRFNGHRCDGRLAGIVLVLAGLYLLAGGRVGSPFQSVS